MQLEAVASPNTATAVEPCARRNAVARARAVLDRRPDAVRAFLSIVDQSIFSGTSFLTAVIVGRATTPRELGLYYLTLTVAYIAVGLQEAMIANPYAILSARRSGRDLAEFTGSTWVQYLSWSAACFVALVTAIVVTTALGGANFLGGLHALLYALPLLLFRECIRRFAFARLQLFVAIAVDLSVSIIQLGGLMALWYFDRLTLTTIFATMALACLVASVAWLLSNRRKPQIVPQRIAGDWRHNWQIARWSLASFLLSNTIPFIMPWIVDISAGAAAAGIFGASATLIGVTNILVLGASNFLMPKAAASFVSHGAAGLRKVLIVMSLLFFVVIGSFCALIFATGDMLSVFVYGPDFRHTGILLAALTANVLAGSLGMIAAQGLLVIGRQRHNFFIDVCLFTTTMTAAAALVPSLGALGAALASLTGATVATLLRAAQLERGLRNLEPAAATA